MPIKILGNRKWRQYQVTNHKSISDASVLGSRHNHKTVIMR